MDESFDSVNSAIKGFKSESAASCMSFKAFFISRENREFSINSSVNLKIKNVYF